MAMSGKGLSKEAFSLCSLKGQKQQNSFPGEEENNLISILFRVSVLFFSLDSYGQNNLEVFFPPIYYQFLTVELFLMFATVIFHVPLM